MGQVLVRVGRWALLAYIIAAGMIEFRLCAEPHFAGPPLAVVTGMLVVFALDVPFLIATTVRPIRSTAPPEDDERFDAAYYRRFTAVRPVHDSAAESPILPKESSRSRVVANPDPSVLDVGAGKGYLARLAAISTRVSYHGIDASEYACRRYGHELADLATWQPPRKYDLVVCQSVLQYLDDAVGRRRSTRWPSPVAGCGLRRADDRRSQTA